MGEYADMIINGFVDQFTGEVIDGDSPGYPRTKKKKRQKKKKKINQQNPDHQPAVPSEARSSS